MSLSYIPVLPTSKSWAAMERKKSHLCSNELITEKALCNFLNWKPQRAMFYARPSSSVCKLTARPMQVNASSFSRTCLRLHGTGLRVQ